MNDSNEATYALVQDVLTDLGLPIASKDDAEHLLVVTDEESGLQNLILDVEDPILVLEMPILKVAPERLGADLLASLLRWNRELVHGAFVLNDAHDLILWRDTLALENLDANEVAASINALEIALAEHAGQLLAHHEGGSA